MALAAGVPEQRRPRLFSALGVPGDELDEHLVRYGVSTLLARGLMSVEGGSVAPVGAALGTAALLAEAHHGVVILPEAEASGEPFMALVGPQAILATVRRPYGVVAVGVLGAGEPVEALVEAIDQLFDASPNSALRLMSENFDTGEAQSVRISQAEEGVIWQEIDAEVTEEGEVEPVVSSNDLVEQDEFFELVESFIGMEDAA